MNSEEKNILEQKIIKKLKTVFDPEIPVDVYELGLIYDIQFTDGGGVGILMTLTAPNCPEAEVIPEKVRQAVKQLHDVEKVEVQITFDPPWNISMASDEAKLTLGMF